MARGRQLLKWYDFISPNIPVGNGANYPSCQMRSKLRLQTLKPSVAFGASSTRCPKRCLKRRRSLWRRKANSNVKSCEEWESSLMICINATCPILYLRDVEIRSLELQHPDVKVSQARGPEPPAQRNAEALNVRLGSDTAPTKRWWRKAAPVF